MELPKPREIYRHFKGNLYQIVAIAEHSETGEQLVIYQALYGEMKIYARPLEMFTSPVDREKYPDVTQEMRFEKVETAAEPVPVAEVASEEAAADAQSVPSAGESASAVENASAGAADSQPDPKMLEFLDAQSTQERLQVLALLHPRITEQMLQTMAYSCDVELPEGELEAQYQSLQKCLMTKAKYETTRLRD
ncbi:MAG: DUF1653 domain-containing protein [Lachnospiraceae bacterium]|nr:DUF1653 domain-containing protein [Lachnospiraceae bacterium]